MGEETSILDRIAKDRDQLWEVTLAEFNVWLASRRQEGVPGTFQETFVMWVNESDIKRAKERAVKRQRVAETEEMIRREDADKRFALEAKHRVHGGLRGVR